MKLLHIIADANPRSGGPIEGVIRQNGASTTDGSREIVSCDIPNAPYLNDVAMTVHALGVEKFTLPIVSRLLRHYAYTPNLIPWLRQNASNYDAIIVNGLWNFSTFAASMTLPRGTVPYFVFTHGMMDPWFRRAYPLKHFAKLCFWLFCEGPLLAGARRVLFTTEEEMVLASGQFPFWKYRGEVVGYGTGAPPRKHAKQDEALRAAVPNLNGRPFLLFLSRIHRKKGCDLLINAFAQLAKEFADLDLVVAGPDQAGLVAGLKRRCKALGIEDRVHWPGMLIGDAKWGAFRGAEAFVLPSHQENFGIVVAEALSCGTPVLISNKVNIWREVKASHAGLVEPDTKEGTLSLLRKWIGLDQNSRSQMGRAARELFDSQYDVASTGPRLMKLISSHIT